jgi:hypothetical protein
MKKMKRRKEKKIDMIPRFGPGRITGQRLSEAIEVKAKK